MFCSTMRSISNNHVRSEADIIVVRQRPGHPSQGLLIWGNTVFPCALGRGGIKALKREGDGATPLGSTRLLYGWFRHGRIESRRSGLALRQITPSDGWCDAPADRNYNRPVTLPYPASSETMERKDRLYDCCIVMDYNIRPRRRGRPGEHRAGDGEEDVAPFHRRECPPFPARCQAPGSRTGTALTRRTGLRRRRPPPNA